MAMESLKERSFNDVGVLRGVEDTVVAKDNPIVDARTMWNDGGLGSGKGWRYGVGLRQRRNDRAASDERFHEMCCWRCAGMRECGSCFCFCFCWGATSVVVWPKHNLTIVEGLSRLKYVTCNFIPNVQLSTSTVTFTSSENMDDTASHSLNSWQ